MLKVGRLLGCIGCNNAALSRELKANAHLFYYSFAERHVFLKPRIVVSDGLIRMT